MRIDELVSMDVQGEFRSDVQLSDYEDPRLNRELLQKYIFTVHAPTTVGAAQRDYAAKDVLDALKTAFTVERGDYRIVLTANYGRGKSHLALALANFFARPADSPEVQTVLERLGQALNNSAQLAGYRDFKKSKGEFLVVRLQGDRCDDLQEGFIRGLEQALQEHNATRGLEMPFWYARAEAWLKNLSGEARQKAERFLAAQNTDPAHLASDLRKQGAYELVREVFKDVTGAYPDFGREINLEELVLWAIDQVCIPYKLGGLLILFDEFSLFLQKYVTARTAGKLQELLNGVSKRPGKSAFLAFSQHDVDTIAETYAQGQRRDDVKKELERLPKDKRARLFSLMEAVLAAYLKQNETNWSAWCNQHPVKAALARGREVVLEHFGKHYSDELKWSVEAFDQKVVKGCFPLHPLTTAILSIHNFEAGAAENPRTALQFVRRAWKNQCQLPAQLENDGLNFVFATELVDFFGDQISKRWYAAYRNALEIAPQALGAEQHKVLQALLIQQAVGLRAFGEKQIELLGQLSGLDEKDVKHILKELAEYKVIQFDQISKFSSLWPTSTHPKQVEDVIQKAIKNIRTEQALEKILASLPQLSLPLSFGHNADWSPRQAVFTADMFTSDRLKRLVQPYRVETGSIQESPRGLIVWLVAQSEEERIQLQENAQFVLDSVLGAMANPLPVVIVLPERPTPGLLAFAQRLKALEMLGTSDREKIGTLVYDQEISIAKNHFGRALDDWVGGITNFADIPRHLSNYILPSVYRASVQALNNFSLKNVVAECYRQAYAYRVEFYFQYPISGKGPNKLRDAVREVVHWLLNDTAGSIISSLGNRDIKHQLATLYLVQKWGLLAVDTFKIQRPTTRALQEAWDLLERTFPAGCNEVRVQAVLLTLLNPPYGHDYNTLTLLVAAWIGYHQHEIRLSLNGQLVSLSRLKTFFDEAKSPQEFLSQICTLFPLAISRAQPDEVFAQLNGILEQIRQGEPFALVRAQDALVKLEQALSNPRLPESKREEIAELRPRLQEALDRAQEYDQRVRDWLGKLEGADFDTLLSLRNVNGLPALSLVLATQPPLESLQKRWETALEKELEMFCRRYATLNDLSDYKSSASYLNHARKALGNYPAFAQKVDEALGQLAQRRDELKQQESEKTIVAEIRSMTPSAGLAVLYEYRERLSKLTNLSPQTAKLCADKQSQIESQIRQYEQIATELPQAIGRVIRPEVLRKQRDLLMRNLEQVQGTAIYKTLSQAGQRITRLEAFFDRLQELDRLARNTPDELKAIEVQLVQLEKAYESWLSTKQRDLLDIKKTELEKIRQQKAQEAMTWLQTLVQRYERGESPVFLFQQLDKPPAFLDSEGLTRLEHLRQTLQKQLEEDLVAQIEDRFIQIKNAETRRRCLKRLHELMGE